jgi:hypothetical protein
MPITDLSTAGFEGNTETTFAPGFPNSPEPWNLATQGQPLPTGGGAGRASWSLGEGGIKTYIAENQHFDVNDNWPETVSATANSISDATAELLPERSAAHADEISRGSPQPQHRSEYRSLAVMRNAHTA